ncbi:hypothetical protein UlMin_008524 [Ulmus minor]
MDNNTEPPHNQSEYDPLQDYLQLQPPLEAQPLPVPPQPNYPAQPTGPVSNPQVNFQGELYVNQPTQTYTPQSPQAQTFQTHQVPPIRPVQFPPQYQPDPMPPNGSNMGQPFPPQPASYRPQPATFQPGQFSPHHGGQAGFAPMPSTFPNGVPSVIPVPNVVTNQWNSDLFDCMNDPMNAIITLFCPCITFGQIAEIIDNGGTSCVTSGMLYGLLAFFIGLPCIISCAYRTKLRNKLGLVESPLPDCVAHFLCECCALCQEYRELQANGLDPSIGCQGNIARQHHHEVNMMPPLHHRMA